VGGHIRNGPSGGLQQIRGIMVVAYLLVLFHALGTARRLFAGSGPLARLERKWIGIWLR